MTRIRFAISGLRLVKIKALHGLHELLNKVHHDFLAQPEWAGVAEPSDVEK